MLQPFWNSWGIARLTLFMVLAPLLCVSIILTYYQMDGRFRDMINTLEIEGGLIADHISNDSEYYLFTNNEKKLQLLIDEEVNRKGVEFLEILDFEGNVIVTAGSSIGTSNTGNKSEVTRAVIYKDIAVDEELQELEPLAVTVGWVHLKMSAGIIDEKKQDILVNSLIILFGGLVISTVLALFISRSLVIPLKKLHSAVENISAGHFNTKLSIQQGGEFGELETGINMMANELRLSNKQQQKKIDDATQALMELVLQLEQKNVLLDEARKEAEEIGNSKVEFLANMSHEIRTPLNAVIGASDFLMKIVRDNNAQKYMTTLSVASNQLNNVVDDILDFSRMEANMLDLEHVSFNIVEILENVISLHAPLAHEKKLDLILQVEPSLPLSLFGDPMRISQVVSNLVSNAIKFTDIGQILVSTTSIVINNIVLRLQINVKDTGAGLTTSAQEKLFDAFSQADSAVARKYGGSGLGLAIVRKLIEQMNGFINVKSSVGEGTEFTIYLDLKLDKQKIDEYEKRLSGMHVLLYEKNRITTETIKNILVYWGVEVTTCQSDDEYFHHLNKCIKAEENYNCILLGTDHEMVTGDTIQQCISKTRKFFLLPIVLMVNANEYDSPLQINDELLCWLVKPVNRQVLFTKLNSINNKDLCIADQSYGVSNKDNETDNTSLLENLNILIAEDNLFNRELLTDMLMAYGARVVAVEDGELAVASALQESFDMIFLDLHMPHKDGITAANEIKHAYLEKQPLLVAATADVFIKDQGDDVEVFDSFVFKPIREEVLLEKIMTLLNFQGEHKASDTVDNGADNAFSEKLDREVRKLVLHIVEGSNSDNYAEIKNYAHQLRGVCGFYELGAMTDIAFGLEKAADNKKRKDIVVLIKVLLKQLNISPDYKKIN